MWISLAGSDGTGWRFNETGALGVINAYATAVAFRDGTYLVRTRDHWLQTIRIMGAHADVELDEQRINKTRKRYNTALSAKLFDLLPQGRPAFNFLVSLRGATQTAREAGQNVFRNASEINEANIRAAEIGLTAAKTTRDASVLSFAIIAAVGTGGTTVALATAGSALGSGVATYQDTGKVDKALLSAGTALIPLGTKNLQVAMKAKGLAQPVIVTVSALADITGDSVKNYYVDDMALQDAVVKALIAKGISTGMEQIAKSVATDVGRTLKSNFAIKDVHGPGGRMSNRTTSLVTTGGAKVAGDWATNKTVDAMMPKGAKPTASGAIESNPGPAVGTHRAWVEAYAMRPA